jgi:hypothetical protein
MSHDLGFGLNINPPQLDKINKKQEEKEKCTQMK